MIVFAGCGSDQGSSQDVLHLVQVTKLESKNRQLEAAVRAQKIEIEQLKTVSQEIDTAAPDMQEK
jgi:hypothetical protein